ncbi:MAG: protein kinase [Phycisphaerales bacterium]|nr:protein kinase [Phycisphaerales bacterium]
MDAQRESQAAALFHSALEYSDEASRAAFLERACASDAELLAAVRALIAADAQTERSLRFGNRAVASDSASTATATASPTVPAAYRAGQFGPVGAPAYLHEALQWGRGDLLFGRWMVESVKQGGMGVVFLCLDHRIGARVAIKIPKLCHAGWLAGANDGFETLTDELLAWRRIGAHRHVLQLREAVWLLALSITESNGRLRRRWIPALLIEYGGPMHLGEHVQANPDLAGAGKLTLLAQIALGMQHAAACGVSPHLDLKPQNILIGDDGAARITDFGLAQLSVSASAASPPGAAHHTQQFDGPAGRVCGTPLYMAPEQWLGSARCDQRTDIYAFGLLTYELFSGIHALWRHAQDGFGAIRTAHQRADFELHDVPHSLGLFVRRCTAVEPRSRFQSWEDLLHGLPQRIVESVRSSAKASTASAVQLVRTAMFMGNADEVAARCAEPMPELLASPAFAEARVWLRHAPPARWLESVRTLWERRPGAVRLFWHETWAMLSEPHVHRAVVLVILLIGVAIGSVPLLRSVVSERGRVGGAAAYFVTCGALTIALGLPYIASWRRRREKCPNCERRSFIRPSATLANGLAVLLCALVFIGVCAAFYRTNLPASALTFAISIFSLPVLVILAHVRRQAGDWTLQAQLSREQLRAVRICKSCGLLEGCAEPGRFRAVPVLQRGDTSAYLGLPLRVARWAWARRLPRDLRFGTGVWRRTMQAHGACVSESSSNKPG